MHFLAGNALFDRICFLSCDVHQVVIHETRVWVVVFGVHKAEPVLFVERNSIQIGIHCQETAASFVGSCEKPFDIV